MALGALTAIATTVSAGGAILNGGNAASDPFYHEEVTIVGDGAYPTGGSTGLDTAYQALDSAHQGRTIVAVVSIDTFGYAVGWDSVNKKLKVYASAGTEQSNAANLSGVTFHLLLISR